MSFSPLIVQLVEALRCLPGVGPKSAQRMALYLLENDRQGGANLAQSLKRAITEVGYCSQCRILSEVDTCKICADPKRDAAILCVVESPADLLAIEQTGLYRGRYFVLKGHLSPIDGVGPEQIGVEQLLALGRDNAVREVIMATSSTVEGEATSHYIAAQLKSGDISVSRLAQGVPLGGELEYVDGSTLAHAFQGRRAFD